jgi:hypothetical protein
MVFFFFFLFVRCPYGLAQQKKKKKNAGKKKSKKKRLDHQRSSKNDADKSDTFQASIPHHGRASANLNEETGDQSRHL